MIIYDLEKNIIKKVIFEPCLFAIMVILIDLLLLINNNFMSYNKVMLWIDLYIK